MRLLALDQSSHITGYSIFIEDQLLTFGHFECSDTNLGKRLNQIIKKINELIQQYQIDEIIFEDIQLQQNKTDNVKTFKVLAEVIGVLEQNFSQQKIKYSIIPPNVWKATFKIAGKGRKQEKQMAQQHALKTYGIQCTEDEADAVCIGAHYAKKNATEWNWV